MTFSIVRILSIAGLVLLAACGDDDTPEDDGSVDSGAGSMDAATKDASAGDKDGGKRTDGSVDTGADAEVDVGKCWLEHFPLYDFDDNGLVKFCAKRAAGFNCPGGCPASLSDFEDGLICDVKDDGRLDEYDSGVFEEEDGGGFVTRSRSEGCGSVQFYVSEGFHREVYNFDSKTGELIGFANTTTDLEENVPGCDCEYLDTTVTGVIRASCPDAVVRLCRAR